MAQHSKIALVFPGQGAQKVGMGQSLYDSHASARQIWDAADSSLGYKLSELAFHGPEEELRQTRNTQAALFTSEVAALEVVRESGIQGAFCAGHSVGEYAALVAAGCLEFGEGLRLVQARGEAMDRAAQARPGAMAAVLGLDASEVGKTLSAASSEGVVVIANYNAPGQIVISGEAKAVEAASAAAQEAGARRVVPLSVSGAFHSPLMESAADDLGQVLETAAIADPTVPVVLNVTADWAKTAEDIRQNLRRQVSSQVRWHESMVKVLQAGADAVLELGPGKVLSGLARRMDGAVEDFSIDEASDLEAVLQSL